MDNTLRRLLDSHHNNVAMLYLENVDGNVLELNTISGETVYIDKHNINIGYSEKITSIKLPYTLVCKINIMDGFRYKQDADLIIANIMPILADGCNSFEMLNYGISTDGKMIRRGKSKTFDELTDIWVKARNFNLKSKLTGGTFGKLSMINRKIYWNHTSNSTDVIIPDYVDYIDYDNSKMVDYNEIRIKNMKILGKDACTRIYYDIRKRIENLEIEYPITTVQYGQFMNFSKLKSVKLPDTVTCIQGEAFKDCCELESINLPSRLNEIQAGAFNGCYNLKKLDLPNKLKTIEERFLMGTKVSDITIPESIEYISNLAFYGSNIHVIRIPESKVHLLEKISNKSGVGISIITY